MQGGESLLLDNDMSIALKNNWGEYRIEEFTLFNLEKLNRDCNRFHIKLSRNRELKLIIKCPICGGYHSYSYSINELVRSDVIIGGCEIMGSPLFYIGNRDNVKCHINRFNEINKKVYAMI